MQTKNYFILFIVTFAFIFSACEPKASLTENKTNPQENLILATIWYNKSAEMQASYIQNYKLAKLMIDKNLQAKKSDKTPAVVLDLDETVLDNSPFQFKQISTQKTYSFKLWTEWVNLAKAEALPGALDFTNYAKSKGVEVFYISNRNKEKHLDATLKNLQNLNFPNADTTHILLITTTSDKTERRNKVSEQYEIILFIGDNLTDFSETFADRAEDMGKAIVEENKTFFGTKYIVMPNPMYGEWLKAIYKNSYKWSPEQMDSLRKAIIVPNY